MPRHSRPMPLHNARESSEKSVKAVIRVSCLVFRENPLVGLAVALVGVAGGQGKTMLRVPWLVKTQQAVLPVRGTAAAHAAP